MNLPASIRHWIELRRPDFPILQDVACYISGEEATVLPPFVAIIETGSTRTEQDGVPIRGVSTVSVTVELHTVPAEDGTTSETARDLAAALYAIIGDIEGMLLATNGYGLTTILDIFIDAPTTDAQDGRRVTTWNLEILAHPFN